MKNILKGLVLASIFSMAHVGLNASGCAGHSSQSEKQVLLDAMAQYPDAVFVNVLQSAGELPDGAVRIPMNNPDFIEQVKEAAGGDMSKTIMVYCKALCGASKMAKEKLLEAGFINVEDVQFP